ncbi:MAG: hypothetical protein PIR02_15905 [Microbacterium enclense]
MSDIPTQRYTVRDPNKATEEITTFLEGLAAAGERPWCEVRYPAPDYVEDKGAWLAEQENTFDVVELVNGELGTAPPYAEIASWS